MTETAFSFEAPSGGASWEVPTASGGGGSEPGRVAPDSHDQIVLYDYPGGATWANSGSGGALDFACAGFSGPHPALGPFGEGALWPEPQLQTDKGGIAFSTATSLGEGQTLTMSAWVYVRARPGSSAPFAVFGKTYLGGSADGVGWSPPYSSVALSLFQGATGIDVLAQPTLVGGSQPVVQVADGITDLPGLHHVGLVVVPGTIYLYVDGVQAADTALAANIDWLSHGGWFIGGIPVGGGGARAYSAGMVADFRVADVARNAGYFAAVWASRRTP